MRLRFRDNYMDQAMNNFAVLTLWPCTTELQLYAPVDLIVRIAKVKVCLETLGLGPPPMAMENRWKRASTA